MWIVKNNFTSKFNIKVIFFVLTLLASCSFVYWGVKCNYKWVNYNKHYCLGYYISAYNFFKHDSLFYWYEKDLYWKDGKIESRTPSSGKVIGNHSIVETIGFSFVAGLLWKFTGSPSFYQVQLLEIFLFALSFIFLYEIALLLFHSYEIAFFTCLSNLAFFPLLYTAIQGRNDIWVYYGIVLLLYVVAKCACDRKDVKLYFLIGLALALIQWIRSTLFFVVLGTSFYLLFSNFNNRSSKFRLLGLILIISQVIFFWVPFCLFNKFFYGRYFVGPIGLALLNGLGEFPNKWGVITQDSWAAKQIPFSLGTVSFDDAAKKMFWNYFKDDPLFVLGNIPKRIIRLLCWNFTWFDYDPALYQGAMTAWNKLLLFSSPQVLLDFFFRTVYIRLYFFVGYIGMALALKDKYYFQVLLLLTCIWSIPIALLSHIEDRYVVVHFWIMSFFVAYLINYFYSKRILREKIR